MYWDITTYVYVVQREKAILLMDICDNFHLEKSPWYTKFSTFFKFVLVCIAYQHAKNIGWSYAHGYRREQFLSAVPPFVHAALLSNHFPVHIVRILLKHIPGLFLWMWLLTGFMKIYYCSSIWKYHIWKHSCPYFEKQHSENSCCILKCNLFI